jgi:hypothetical protein
MKRLVFSIVFLLIALPAYALDLGSNETRNFPNDFTNSEWRESEPGVFVRSISPAGGDVGFNHSATSNGRTNKTRAVASGKITLVAKQSDAAKISAPQQKEGAQNDVTVTFQPKQAARYSIPPEKPPISSLRAMKFLMITLPLAIVVCVIGYSIGMRAAHRR